VKKAGFLFVCVCSLDLPTASIPQTKATEPQVMTYEEAKAAGIAVPPLPSETGMRVCSDSDFGSGFASAEEAERSLEEYEAMWGEAGSPNDCQLDPTKGKILVFPSDRFR